jgi:acyl dehydratase
MAGKYFEELEVGQVFRHQPGRTITGPTTSSSPA